jgi:hypothetical protein
MHTGFWWESQRGEAERDRPLGRPRYRWENNIKIDLWEIGLGGMDWTHLAQDSYKWQTLVNTAMNLRIPYNVRKAERAELLVASQKGPGSMETINCFSTSWNVGCLSKALKAVVIECHVFREISMCIRLKVNQRFGGPCGLHLRCLRVR